MSSVRDRLEERLAAIAAQKTPVFLKTYADAARASADAADARRRLGISLGPLDGRIVSLKDLFDVAGEVTTAGSKILADQPPATQDAPIVQRLRQAGAVIIGKTNMSEFAFSAIGVNPHFGTPGNAANPLHVPGGSSSGAAVSAAEGTSDIAIGTDTGGSIRSPASLNGCVGFKPSAQRVSRDGAFPLSYTLDSIGPLARNVADCAACDAVMAGEAAQPLQPFPLAGLRLGVIEGSFLDACGADVAKAYAATLKRLEKAGARLVPFPLGDLVARIDALQGASPLVTIEAAAAHRDWYVQREADYDRRVFKRIGLGWSVTATEYIAKLRARAALIAEFCGRAATVDALVSPATLICAPMIAAVSVSDDEFFRLNGLVLRITTIGNMLDTCGISLPMPDTGAMPAGLLISGANGADHRILAIAAGVEAALA